ncbi:TPA: hypothetical protein DEG21_00345 [Patescibacteria group bacterium]|nr:hypothetical protein [Candidatus Gracilibacteria bacterium]HBY74376.1 hypothetical protein [Candidatus Gracilibacteria bacterium]
MEVIIKKSEILSKSKTPPFEINDFSEANEEIRFKHRYLDIRRKKVLSTIEFRAAINQFTRNWFIEN